MAKRVVTELSRLTPKSISVKTEKGTIILAGDADENRILNYLLAAKIRAFIEENLERYQAAESQASPKDLKDIVEAARGLFESTAELYKGGEPVTNERAVDAIPIDTTDFSKLNKNDDPAGKTDAPTTGVE